MWQQIHAWNLADTGQALYLMFTLSVRMGGRGISAISVNSNSKIIRISSCSYWEIKPSKNMDAFYNLWVKGFQSHNSKRRFRNQWGSALPHACQLIERFSQEIIRFQSLYYSCVAETVFLHSWHRDLFTLALLCALTTIWLHWLLGKLQKWAVFWHRTMTLLYHGHHNAQFHVPFGVGIGTPCLLTNAIQKQ